MSGEASKKAGKEGDKKGAGESSNPSKKAELSSDSKEKAAELLRKIGLADMLAKLETDDKKPKEMSSHAFWNTQPVMRYDDDEKTKSTEGPINIIDPEKVSKTPRSLPEGFEWVTVDITDSKELDEIHELLTDHYVEDDHALFRLNYSNAFMNWVLKPPGWRKEWNVGVRVKQTKKLVAFVSAIPVEMQVKDKVLHCSEVNFLCVRKKLRDKRLAPVMIEEITRQCYLVGVYQAVYTVGKMLPKPVSSCRYYHRPLNWPKLYEVGFSHIHTGSTKARMIKRNEVPSKPGIPGIRLMKEGDVDQVLDLLQRYLKGFQFAPVFTREEVVYWFLHDDSKTPEQVMWTYVVEDEGSGKITDFTSFYCLDSKVIGNDKYSNVKAAYGFYYASEWAFMKDKKAYKERLNSLMVDTLVLAKAAKFDVFNALSLLDNPLFIEQQKFGPGDGQLYYYLYNYRTAAVPGGVNAENKADEGRTGGVGLVMF